MLRCWLFFKLTIPVKASSLLAASMQATVATCGDLLEKNIYTKAKLEHSDIVSD